MGCGQPTTVATLAELLGGTIVGDPTVTIRGVNALDDAGAAELAIIGDAAHAGRWARSGGAAAVVASGLEVRDDRTPARPLVVVDDADLAMARVLEHFAPPRRSTEPGVHELAAVDPSATVADDARIDVFASVGAGAVIEAGAVLGPGTRVGPEAVVGPGAVLHENAVLGARCRLGARTVLYAGAVVGADGFGFRPDRAAGRLVRMPHIGTVVLGDDVEVGAGTCIDRGKFGATTVGDGTKIDNLVQIGHNGRIGRHVVIAGCSGIAGSVTVGDWTQIGGMVAIREHVRIGSGVRIGATSGVMDDIPDGATVLGCPAQDHRAALREVAALRKLPRLLSRLERDSRSAHASSTPLGGERPSTERSS